MGVGFFCSLILLFLSYLVVRSEFLVLVYILEERVVFGCEDQDVEIFGVILDVVYYRQRRVVL